MVSSVDVAVQRLRESYASARKFSVACAACGSERSSLVSTLDRHELGLHSRLCRNCSLVFTSPRPSDEWFEEFYEVFYWPVYIGSRFRDADDMFVRDGCRERASAILDGFLSDVVTPVSRCLDVGAGQGGMLVELKHRFPNAELLGIEPSAAGVEFCRSRHGMKVQQLSWECLATDELHGSFDLVTLIHVLEHVLDPLRCLQSAIGRLSEQGYLYVEVPDILSAHWSGCGILHIAHVMNFSAPSLTRLVQRAGGRVVKVYHGLAPIWPWAIGLLVQRETVAQASVSPIRPMNRREIQQMESTIRNRLGLPEKGGFWSRLTGVLSR